MFACGVCRPELWGVVSQVTRDQYIADVTGAVELSFNAGRGRSRRAPKRERLASMAGAAWDLGAIYDRATAEERFKLAFFTPTILSILGQIAWALWGKDLFAWLWSKLSGT